MNEQAEPTELDLLRARRDFEISEAQAWAQYHQFRHDEDNA